MSGADTTNTTIETIRKLNAINVDFYRKSALYFDNSRSQAWEGWSVLLDKLNFEPANSQPLGSLWSRLTGKLKKSFGIGTSSVVRVLDLGCGNGRFYPFLKANFQRSFEYTGIDANEFLIAKATERYPEANVTFIRTNIGNVDHILQHKFDLIVMFRVMHHVPGVETRLKILRKCRHLLAPASYLVFDTWRFLDSPRAVKSIINPKTVEGRQVFADLGLNPNELQTNDYLLDWHRGVTAYRYCHYYTQEEVADLVGQVGLEVVDSYQVDDKDGELDQYYICQIRSS